MKKTLFFILAVAFCVSLAAQTKALQDFKNLRSKLQNNTVDAVGSNDEGVNFAPLNRPSNYVPKARGTSYQIGETYYFLATNSFARNTIDWSPDGETCAAVWMAGGAPTGNPLSGVRGTAINYYDAVSKSWGPCLAADPVVRIENGPMTKSWSPGWGAHAFTEEGECVISHCAALDNNKGGIIVNTKEKRGEGEWIQSELYGPTLSNGSHVINWPTMCGVGNTLHMFLITSQDEDKLYVPVNYPDSTLRRAPLYYRSTDGGKNWGTPYDFSDILSFEELSGFGGDNYVITARGSHVVVAFSTWNLCLAAYLESTDDGTTWTKKVVYSAPFDWETPGILVPPTMYPVTMAATLGDDDVVHIAFSANPRIRKTTTDPNKYSFYPGLSALFAWNDKQPPLTAEDMGIEYDEAADKIGDRAYESMPNYLFIPEIIGLDTFHFWNPFELEMIPDNYDGRGCLVSHPRLLAEGGKVYLLYSSMLEQPLLCPANDYQFMRGVFMTVSFDNGATYDQLNHTSWLSYDPDMFYCDWSDWQIDEEKQQVGGSINVEVFSESGYPSMATSIKNDMLVCTWMNDLLPFPERENGANPNPWVAEGAQFKVFAVTLKTSEAGTSYNNTRKICHKIKEQTVVGKLKVYPNPAQGNVHVELNHNDPFTLTVTNLMGQVVHTAQGKSIVEFNVSNYTSGIYIVNVITAKTTISQKLIVQ